MAQTREPEGMSLGFKLGMLAIYSWPITFLIGVGLPRLPFGLGDWLAASGVYAEIIMWVVMLLPAGASVGFGLLACTAGMRTGRRGTVAAGVATVVNGLVLAWLVVGALSWA